MKTNYGLLFFSFVISIFMLLSLNSFSTSAMYLPALFLYFLSNIATFIDKYIYYRDLKLSAEKRVSLVCFLLCVFMVCIYISDSLGFAKITFHNVSGTYRMLIQGVPNSFFTFNSIDITTPTFVIAAIIPITYMFFSASASLRELGLTTNKIISIVTNNKKSLFFIPFLSLLVGASGVLLCHYKYINTCCGFGQPQYIKYFSVFFIATFTIVSFCFVIYNKDKGST